MTLNLTSEIFMGKHIFESAVQKIVQITGRWRERGDGKIMTGKREYGLDWSHSFYKIRSVIESSVTEWT